MARKGINFDQVANAARTIKARGQEATIAAVRVECGNEGSFTTISAHLAKWRTEEADKVEMRSLPAEVEDSMMTTMMSVWNVANKQADIEKQALKQEFSDEKRRMISELEEAQDEIKMLEKVLKDEEERATKNFEKSKDLELKLNSKTSEADAVHKLYKELVSSLKLPTDKQSDAKGSDTKLARPKLKEVSPGSKQA